MKARLAWAGGGFVLVALLVYRFLTRVPSPDVAPVAAPVAPAAAPAPAPSASPTTLEPLAAVFPFVPAAPGPVAAGGPGATPPPPAAAAPILTLAPAPADEPEDEAPPVAAVPAPVALVTEAADADEGSADVDPDERIEALRRKLDEARGGAGAAEPPLDDRRRSVHDVGRSAAEAMRRTVERPLQPEDAAAPVQPPVPGDDDPVTG